MASSLSLHPLTTKTTIHAGEPSYQTTFDTTTTDKHVAYDVGFASIILLFILILIYTSYMCKRWKHSRSPPPPPSTTSDSDDDDFHSIINLEDGILSNFPTFVYSDAVKIDNESGCPICLAEYEPVDVVRLLPECGHLFHVGCIDTWLKVSLVCPVCRKSSLPT